MNKSRYYLIACGTSRYNQFAQPEQLPSVQEDLELVIELFTEHFGYEQVLTDLQNNPNAETLRRQFAEWLQDEARCETDIVIFYYSGHGEDAQGDRHYLLMEDTDPNIIGQTALATEELIRPLKNEGVKIAQILYIIDTCYAQGGAGDITRFATKVIQQFQPVEGKNINVCTIAACRAKQTATEGVFSQALKDSLMSMYQSSIYLDYIDPAGLVESINDRISQGDQRVQHNNISAETSACFFPIFPKAIKDWDKQSSQWAASLFKILKEQIDDSLFFINSFLLSSQLLEEFVLDESELKEKLKELSRKPVSGGICPLIACSEWCRLRFWESYRKLQLTNDEKISFKNILGRIENWKDSIVHFRKGVDLNEISSCVSQFNQKFKQLINNESLRIQIEIEPKIDERNNTGQKTGQFLLSINLWIKSQEIPLGRFAENIFLQSLEGRLISSLEERDLLSNLIRKTRYSLPDAVKLSVELFMPFECWQDSCETICFKSGRNQKPLGQEYPIFINSFERYFDEDFREIRDAITEQKQAMWQNDNILRQQYYIGTEPSESDLGEIEEKYAIAVWSRKPDDPLDEEDEKVGLNSLEWQQCPHKIHELRKNKREITLFWDDLYPKPSERTRPLSTRVVE